MNLDTLKWEKIAPLLENRCTSMIFTFNEKIYVAGGFFTNGQRLRTLECYDPVLNNWQMLGSPFFTKAFRSHILWRQQSHIKMKEI